MRALACIGLFLAAAALALCSRQPAAADGEKPTRKAFGLDRRVPWTTSNLKGFPEPPPPYRTERAFPRIKFDEPLDLTYAPGTDRLFVAERWGKIYSFVNR